MKFLSGSKNRTITYTVRPHRVVMHPTTGARVEVPAIRAEFKEHRFDSVIAAQNLGWDELDRMNGDKKGTTRKMVEKYLQEHQDWGRADGRGLFFGELTTIQELELRAKGAKKRCVFQQDAGDGNLTMCNNEVEDISNDYCNAHQEIVDSALAALAGQEQKKVQEPATS